MSRVSAESAPGSFIDHPLSLGLELGLELGLGG